MSVWTYIEGKVNILKSDKVSVKDVFRDILTDEIVLDIKTEDRKHYYAHDIRCRARIDGEIFMERYKDLIEELKPIRGSLDLTCEVRIFY